MKKDLKRLSKFLAVVLRHSPEKFSIKLDEKGFTPLDGVLDVVERNFKGRYSLEDIELIATNGDGNGKKRYEIVDGRIRALYGHSQPEIVYPSIEPPTELFHGTNKTALANIRKHGLMAQNRQYVHMTTDLQTAKTVATRHTNDPIILTVRAHEAYKDGVIFHNPENNIYLARAIPSNYIVFPSN